MRIRRLRRCNMKRSPKEWYYIVRRGPGTRLPSGGIYPPWGHIGHWEVTGKVIEEMGFSSPGSNILCDASQDPDFYNFGTVAAHAQTPDEADRCGPDQAKRTAIIDKAIRDYVAWVEARFQQCRSALDQDNARLSLYWLGYALHGVEDLAVHKGITNGEHASTSESPDFQAADVALSSVYARRMLDAVRNALGQDNFDRLRNHDGEGKLSFSEKHRKDIHPGGWDIDNRSGEYRAAGKKYKTIDPAPDPVRWDREFVLSLVLETILMPRIKWVKSVRHAASGVSANPHRRFEVLKPLAPLSKPAQWTVLVYMAGDDRSPNGIEYAIAQDLAEIKQVGSTDSVHFIVQTDDATGKASYRYHLRKGTDLASDRIERFNGDLNSGSTKTLVDFVKWAHYLFPAERTALVLWGHGSGHDDQNVYRTVRGSVNPRTAARLAQKRMGFFSSTRRSILEQGPTRGYGYDDTAGDFLDNAELRKTLLQVKGIIGRKLDLLGFDACLMAMIEVAYQIHDVARILVASERTEPGDGWWYSRALRGLAKNPKTPPSKFAGDIVRAYRDAYQDDMTLSAIDLEKIPLLARNISDWAKTADPAGFHYFRRQALDCSPRPGDGYCDLGTFLDAALESKKKGSEAASVARKTLKLTIIASCGRASGLTIYAPGNFRPLQAGSTDALYMGLNFIRETEWGNFLKRVYPRVEKAIPGIETLPIPTPISGLDRYNARHVLAAVLSDAKEDWIDRLRQEILGPCKEVVANTAKQLDRLDPPQEAIKSPSERKSGKSLEEERRIIILPGIMGSLLHDRSGKLGGVWIDPWNLIFGDDFDGLKLKWETDGRRKTPSAPVPLPQRIADADDSVQIEAYGVIPLIYDRLALALIQEFGPVVEYAPFDWRQPIDLLGQGLATRIEAITKKYPAIQIALVAHSMGGLVAANAFSKLEARAFVIDTVKALIVMGTPFLGSASAFQALRAERKDLLLLKLLGRKSAQDIENTIQTFRGLFDMMPVEQEALLQPACYAPGPLSRLSPGDPRLNSPLNLVRDLAPGIQKRTRVIVCTTKNTTGTIVLGEDGSADYSETVAGDGTVPARSALNAGKLLSQSDEVYEGHMTLPLDGEAIGHTIDWIGQQLGLPPTKSLSRAWPPAPDFHLPESREDLMHHLEDDGQLTLGDFVALISLI
jgi:pimeloyl-ACP methyl ester carboxylesterase